MKINDTIKVNTYEILERAVKEGLDYGYRRGHKHTDEPSEINLKTDLSNGIMLQISEILNFDETSLNYYKLLDRAVEEAIETAYVHDISEEHLKNNILDEIMEQFQELLDLKQREIE